MKKNIFIIILMSLCFTGLSGCGESSTSTKYRLELQPNEKYLVKEQQSSSKLIKSLNTKMAEDTTTVDYTFEIPEVDVSESNANDLLIGPTPELLQPVAFALNSSDTVIKTFSTEETIEKFNPITEFSQSGFGNKDIDATAFNTEQKRTCYSISKSGAELQSKYYNISITIMDTTPAVSDFEGPWDARNYCNYGVTYESKEIYEKLADLIYPHFTDNNKDLDVSYIVFYSPDGTEYRQFAVQPYLKEHAIDKENHKMAIIPMQFSYFDGNTLTKKYDITISLKDEVAPVLFEKDGVTPVTTANLVDIGPRADYPEFAADIKKAFVEKGYRCIDEVTGEIPLSEIRFGSVSPDGFTVSATDGNGNTMEYNDTYTKFSNADGSFVWFPEGTSATMNPERGLKCKFIGSEISILGPNITVGQNIKYRGTDGVGGVQILPTMDLYGRTYEVTKLDDYCLDANYYTKSKAENAENFLVDSIYAYPEEKQENVYDLRNTNISLIGRSTLSPNHYHSSQNNIKIILCSKKPYITLSLSSINMFGYNAPDYASSTYVSKNIRRINNETYIIGCPNLYFEYESEDAANAVLGTKWAYKNFDIYDEPDFKFNYTLEQYLAEKGIK